MAWIEKLLRLVKDMYDDVFGRKDNGKGLTERKMKRSRGQGIQLPNDEAIRNTLDGVGYEYLGLLEADRFKKLDMKEKVTK